MVRPQRVELCVEPYKDPPQNRRGQGVYRDRRDLPRCHFTYLYYSLQHLTHCGRSDSDHSGSTRLADTYVLEFPNFIKSTYYRLRSRYGYSQRSQARE